MKQMKLTPGQQSTDDAQEQVNDFPGNRRLNDGTVQVDIQGRRLVETDDGPEPQVSLTEYQS